ncbi:ribosomal protein L1p/L10e family-domain-containing protein [Protomyces lactucae-debilis]|uniref:Ribosomal protein L1p/L10e family-domain-containing protein n=1 Tax=Protomyces lactucae-debilis TaxID=2754530 RepID=A0A1Y2FDJ7_PROLT|nr:ribosomal protein L1p/L10e family-domain-containing protein [Protomyces lactucae-debilis]ORY81494.1 ribosomal protein L1p/L10e family-domain-containing protein [Protomyces lactucae-debilis]
MAKASQLPSELDSSQVLKASKALLKHIQKEATTATKPSKKNLLATDVDAPELDTPIWLSLTTKKFIIDTKRLKPARIPLVHSIVADDATVCLITKDPQRLYKDMVETAGLDKKVTRVVGVTKLKGKHKTFEAKRALRDAHDVFFADDRVVHLLPSILGKTFYAGKHNPIPVVLPAEKGKEDHLKIEIEKALASTYLHLAPGTCTTIKVGLAGQTAAQVADNIKAVADKVIETYVPQKWQNVKSLHIKTAASVALPIYMADKVFDPEMDKVQDAEATQAIEEKKNARKRKHSKEVPGIELESVQEVVDGVPQPAEAPNKKAKKETPAANDKATASATKSKDAPAKSKAVPAKKEAAKASKPAAAVKPAKASKAVPKAAKKQKV